MLRIKSGPSGARIAGLRVEALAALMVAARVFEFYGDECVLTAGCDSKHMPGSLHYVGLAIDVGLPADRPGVRAAVLAALTERLGDDYDVVLEADHFHIEFQPKRPINA